MKKILSVVVLASISSILITSYTVIPPKIKATCNGAKNCNACKNCKYCKHCSKNGGTCGVCK